jgi:DNA-binding transcriptional ArsR family regulator
MISKSELLEFMKQHDEPFVTASDVADAEGVAQQTAYKHLKRLYESGAIKKKKVGGSATIWWIESRCD